MRVSSNATAAADNLRLPDIHHNRSSSKMRGRLQNRRGVISMVAAVAGCVATAAMTSLTPKATAKPVTSLSNRPDAELLKLGAQFDQAYADWLPIFFDWKQKEDAFYDDFHGQFGAITKA